MGTSKISYTLISNNQNNSENDNFLRINYSLGNSGPSIPYCGIYTDFSTPPYGVLTNVSSYNGVEFDVRSKQQEDSGNPKKLFISIASLGIPNYIRSG
ncbi:MAG: hypothetical protein AB4290_05220 [Spirulina sp.]